MNAAELFVEVATDIGPEIDLETLSLISSCKSCEEYYDEATRRMDALEQNLELKIICSEQANQVEEQPGEELLLSQSEQEPDVEEQEIEMDKTKQHNDNTPFCTQSHEKMDVDVEDKEMLSQDTSPVPEVKLLTHDFECSENTYTDEQ